MRIFALFLGNVRFCRQQMRQVSTHPYNILYEENLEMIIIFANFADYDKYI